MLTDRQIHSSETDDSDYAVEAGNVNLSNLNPTDWICISSVGDIKATKYYKNYSFSLEQFKGKDIYVAIRHYHVSDQYALLVDDFRFDGTDALTYKKIARTEPNLGKEGNVECWLGSDGKKYLDPRANATRQETATILMRFMNRYMPDEPK